MRSGKIISWLFTLAQFILFIKLVEYVQGVEVSGSSTTTVANFENIARTTSLHPSVGRQGNGHVAITNGSQTTKFRIPVVPHTINKYYPKAAKPQEAIESRSTGRACPACEGNGCNANVIQSSFPFLQLKVAAAVIFIWYLIFLKVWKYPLVQNKKPQKPQGYAPSVQPYGGYSSGGYSGGNPSSYTGSNYSPVPNMPVYGDTDSDSDNSGFGGILDTIYKAYEQFSN